MKNSIKRSSLYSGIFAFATFLSVKPYFVWFNTKLFNYVIGVILVLLILQNWNNLKRPFSQNIGIIWFYFFLAIYLQFGGTTYSAFSPIWILPLFFITQSEYFKVKILKDFVKILSIIYILGIIVYLVRFIVPLPSFNISHYTVYKTGYFSCYLFDVNYNDGLFPRFSSVFDEPGVVGTINALLISYKRLNYKTYSGFAILLAGLLSFSLAFYVVLMINLVYQVKNKFTLPITIVFLVIIMIGLPKDNIVKKLILDRLEITDDGKLSGDNRGSFYLNLNYDYFVQKGGMDIVFGRGYGSESKDDDRNTGGTYKTLIYRHGYVGISIIILFFLFVTWKIAPNKNGWFFLFIFYLLAYQRTDLFLLYYIVIFFGGLSTISLEMKEKGQNKFY
jgi:hypothetical protein